MARKKKVVKKEPLNVSLNYSFEGQSVGVKKEDLKGSITLGRVTISFSPNNVTVVEMTKLDEGYPPYYDSLVKNRFTFDVE